VIYSNLFGYGKHIYLLFYTLLNYLNNSILLDTVGIVSPYAYKKGRKVIIDKNKFMNIPYSFLSMLIGLIDGDGYISATKTVKGYIRINLIISLDIRDLSLLEYIKSILEIGKINTYPKVKTKKTCKLVINSTDLKEVFFPLLIYHKLFFLTNVRRKQFDKAMFLFINNINLYSKIPDTLPSLYPLLSSAEDYINLPFFNN
jgi:LAGLIDADG endonuclease.